MEREEILRRFETWLDCTLDAEGPPEGIAAGLLAALTSEGAGANGGIGASCDLYSIEAAVTALTQEVKLQGRSFKQLGETLAPIANLAPALPEMERMAIERARREVIDVLLDLRERLARGLEAARAAQAKMQESLESNWTSRLIRRHAIARHSTQSMAALEEGYRMSLARLDEVLEQFGLQEIDCQGKAFDPGLMHAVDVEETDDAPEGTVMEIYRAGYHWNGDVHRPAQVRVARRRIAVPEGEDNDE